MNSEVIQAIDFLIDNITGFFGIVVNSWLLSCFLFVAILYMIIKLILQVRNK